MIIQSFILTLKRFKAISLRILALLVIMPLVLTAFLQLSLSETKSGQPKVGFSFDKNDDYSVRLYDLVKKIEACEIVLYSNESLDEMKNDVISSKLECAYSVKSGFANNFSEGTKVFDLYISESSMLPGIINESMTTAALNVLSGKISYDYLTSNGFSKESLSSIEERVSKYINTGNLMKIDYVYAGSSSDIANVSDSATFSIAHGMLSIFALFCAIIASSTMMSESDQLTRAKLASRRLLTKYYLGQSAALFFVFFFSMIISVLCIMLNGQNLKFAVSIQILLLYCAALVSITLLLSVLIKSVRVLPIIAIPGAILSIAIGGVFFDIGTIIAPLSNLKYLFLPYYYVSAMNDYNNVIISSVAMASFAFIFTALSIILPKRLNFK